MNIAIIGANGFVGPHLVEELKLRFPDSRLIGTHLKGTDTTVLDSSGIDIEELDITDTHASAEFLKNTKPDHLVNLAAQSSVGFSWKNPALTFRVNVIGTLNLLQGISENSRGTRMLVIGSSEEYESGRKGLNEKDRLDPSNPYGISKSTQESLARLFAHRYGIHVVLTRSFNHTGPGQLETFVVPDWCRQIVRIERGDLDPVISVGNLDVRRDFSHVDDIVGDYALLMERGKSGEVYNAGSGKSYGLDEILRILIGLSTADIEIRVDEAKFRPAENEVQICDRSKIDRLGGRPYRSIHETLADTLESWRRKQ